MPSSSLAPADGACDFGTSSGRRGALRKAPSMCSVAEVRMALQRVVGEVIAAAPAVVIEGCTELFAGDGDASSLPDLGLKLTIS
ncbi:hypothetical protein E2562_007336 [Oryza meyeriana var. granulata]|uniref:Uncharacterized protein n=1 Tax=Oryza meyeriana var. granulata TaxID=110450 RepID=A0A6G1CZI4_9ORYZ|nr:hypothetical protein E2562_007336 [Oryza meyeriana var. granulata]